MRCKVKKKKDYLIRRLEPLPKRGRLLSETLYTMCETCSPRIQKQIIHRCDRKHNMVSTSLQ